MNDDISGQFLQMGGEDPVLAEDNARFRAAQEQEQQAELGATGKEVGFNITDVFEGVPSRPLRWLYRLPTNLAAGTWRALGNTIDTATDLMGEVVETVAARKKEKTQALSGNKGAGKAEYATPDVEVPSLSEAYPELMAAFYGIADDLEKHNRTEDDITVGMTQFAVPFTGWLKAMGGVDKARKAVTVAKAAGAEAATAGSAFDPQEGRFADLAQMGRELDGRFGDFMRTLSPDGSLVNRYIDYMTNRADEGPWEGRWKNAVDSLTTTAAVAGFLKASGVAYRKARHQIDKKADKLKEAQVPDA